MRVVPLLQAMASASICLLLRQRTRALATMDGPLGTKHVWTQMAVLGWRRVSSALARAWMSLLLAPNTLAHVPKGMKALVVPVRLAWKLMLVWEMMRV